VVNEAAACGLPLVVSDRVGAGKDLVIEGENGFVVAVEDAVALGRAIVETLSAENASGEVNEVSREKAIGWGYDRASEELGAMTRCIAWRSQGRAEE